MSITYRSVKGSKLTSDEVDGNFLFLENQVAGGNRFTSFTGFSLAGQNLTLNSGSNWVINTVGYVNASAVVINIPYAASGMERIDLIVANASNTFVRVAGVESASNPVAPAVPANTVQATFVSVTDGSVGSGGTPIVGNEYVEKIEFTENPITDSGDLVLTLDTESTAYRLTGSVTSLIGFDATLLFDSANAYVGKEVKVVNNTGAAFPITHNDGTVNYPVRFPSEVDFLLNDKEVIVFKIVKTDVVHCEFVSVGRDSFSGGVTPKYATLTSSDLSSQDVSGFVIYANALSPNLVIAPDELYDFIVTDTGQIFKLYLSGVTIGLGQTAITTSNVQELKRDIVYMLRLGFGQNAYGLSNGATGFNNLHTDCTVTGTAQATTQTPAGNMTSALKYRFITGVISTATAGSTASVRSTAPFIYFGKPCIMEFFNTLEDASVISDGRSFSGIRSASAVIGNVEPSSLISMIALANDSTDTNMQIMHNDPTGTAAKIDLGASFPAHYAKGDHSYRMLMYVESATSVFCYVEDIVTGVNTWRHITTELPLAGQQYAHTWLNNAATAQARILSFYGYERKYL